MTAHGPDTGQPPREFWFSQALEDAEGEAWPLGAGFDDHRFTSDGGLIDPTMPTDSSGLRPLTPVEAGRAAAVLEGRPPTL